MKKYKKEVIILFVKDKDKKICEITEQTKTIRNDTNKKIKDLGNKFYIIKNIFDKLNLKRDDIFQFGRQLVEEYSEVKKGIKLQNTKKRMKDALICWYCENFFQEFLDSNSGLLKRMAELSINPQKVLSTKRTIITQNERTINNIDQTSQFNEVQLPKSSNEDYNIINNISFQGIKINQEIDSFDNSNIICQTEDSKEETHINANFDFLKMFQF